VHMVQYGMTDTFSSRAGTTNYIMSAGERGRVKRERRGEKSDSLSDWYMFISYVHYFLA
jgi:hypothetical protein